MIAAVVAATLTTAISESNAWWGCGRCGWGGGLGYGSGYGYGYGYGAPLYDYAAPAYGYTATAPLYNYAAPAYGYAAPAVAPAQGATTIVIVTPAPAYTAPPVASGYYGAPVVSQPIYDYTPGYWNRGYWGRYGYGWR